MPQETTKIKICGLRIPADVDAVNEVLPEYCGFIFVPGRRRYVSPKDAESLRQRLDPRIRPVGVFVNAGTQAILDVLKVCHLDMVQLHGQETNEEIDGLRAAVSAMIGTGRSGAACPVRPDEAGGDQTGGGFAGSGDPARRPFQIVRAYRIDTAQDMETAAVSHADLILLDHGAGGTGESFDWSLIRDCGRPFILAGGLTPENVAQAVARTHPFAVDVSSSLETQGHKDPEKVRAFVRAVRGVF